MLGEVLNLVEVVPIIDTFVMGIGKVEILGSAVRATYYVMDGGQPVVVAKIVRSINAWPAGTLLSMIQRAQAVGAPKSRSLSLSH